MRAEMKYFVWHELEGEETALPEVAIHALVFAAPPLHGPGEETFHATVCTPEDLADMVQRDGVVIGRHLIFLVSVNRAQVEETIRDRLRRIDGETWHELAAKIGRVGLGEFEDYTHSTVTVTRAHAADHGLSRPMIGWVTQAAKTVTNRSW